jgi:hypothetical protein
MARQYRSTAKNNSNAYGDDINRNTEAEAGFSNINDLMELVSQSGTAATVIGDPKQSRPISPVRIDYSVIE